jgi:hypothetical protein
MAKINPWLAMTEQNQVPLMLQEAMAAQPSAPMPAPQMPAFAQASSSADDKYAQLMNRMENRTLQGIKDQRESVQKLKDYQASLAQQESQFDLSPLMTLADQWTGSKMAQSYQRPETAAEKKARIMQVEQQIAGQSSKITDDELGLLKTQLMGEMYKNKADVAANKDPKITAEQWKAGGFAARMADADSVISGLENQGTDIGTQAQMSKFFPGVFMNEDSKKIDQAQRNFINATLRRESGAAISPSEFASAEQQYFPKPGDTPEVLAQKRQNRQRVSQSFALEGGNAYQQIIGQNPIAGGGSKPQTVNQGGHTYTLNPATGEYE